MVWQGGDTVGSAWQEYERSRARSKRTAGLFAPAVAAAVAALAIHHFYGQGREVAEPAVTASTSAVPVVPGEIVERPTLRPAPDASGVTVAPGQRAYAADGTVYVGVYECTVNGQRVVSDRPCGSGATERVLEVAPAQAPPPPVPQYRPTRPTTGPTPARNAAGSASAVADNTAACAAVDRAIDNLNSQMRQGYGSAEGEYLRAEWHRLKQRRYDLGCGR
jgi:hypothetical protein